MAQPNHPPTSRTRERPTGDEEAGPTLKLGEFSHVPTLSLSEVRLLLQTIVDARQAKNVHTETETLTKTQDYLDVFARFKAKENIEAVERLLTNHGVLESFERSQLGTLCCESAEEAKFLIPSLTHKISDADLEELLREISNLRAYVE